MIKQVTSAVLIGYGSIGRYHARLLDGRYDQLAIVDFNESARTKACADFPSATVAPNLSELDALGWEWDQQMAVIATWGPSHVALFGELARRGVRRILCEKPLANSVKSGAAMIETSEERGITLGVHQHLRYSGFVAGLNMLSKELALGEPCSLFILGGAIGLITRGIHWIDLACELFGRGPFSVVSSAVGSPMNPRSSELMFYGGTAAWDFGDGREATLCLSNISSVDSTVNIYYRDAVVRVFKNLDVEVRRRARAEVERFPAVTRVGQPTEEAFTGALPGIVSIEERTTKLLEEIESGTVRVFPPTLALQSLSACIGALTAGRCGQAVSLPIDPTSEAAEVEWPIS